MKFGARKNDLKKLDLLSIGFLITKWFSVSIFYIGKRPEKIWTLTIWKKFPPDPTTSIPKDKMRHRIIRIKFEHVYRYQKIYMNPLQLLRYACTLRLSPRLPCLLKQILKKLFFRMLSWDCRLKCNLIFILSQLNNINMK